MARESSTFTAFSALRDTRTTMGLRLGELSALLPEASDDPRALRRVMELACELTEMLTRVAEVEESSLFPRLERWFGERAAELTRARRQRSRLHHALVGLLVSMRLFLAQKTLQRAELIAADVATVTTEFREWVRNEELGLFVRCEAQLGRFASRVLGSTLLLSFASDSGVAD